jgi:hypothetical protein
VQNQDIRTKIRVLKRLRFLGAEVWCRILPETGGRMPIPGSPRLAAGVIYGFERDLIRSRTGEGRERAKARGVKLGRKPKLTEHQRREAIRRREEPERVREIARSYNVSHSTISRLPLPGAPHG